MKWTGKALPFVLALTLVVVYIAIRTAGAAPDSEQSPLYEATLNQAYVEMRTVRTADESNREPSERPNQILQTTSPPVFTKCNITHSSTAYTCGPAARTNCTIGTWCPKTSTECPGNFKYTVCKATHSPNDITDCVGRSTYCVVKTWCPSTGNQTACSRTPKYTECKITRSVGLPTNCGSRGATNCAAETYCPAVPGKCDTRKTVCPRVFTKCQTTHQPDALTMCLVDPETGKCVAKTWYPAKETECPKKVTVCKVTHEPKSPTKCNKAPTKCQAYTRCPEKKTQCPEQTTLCPPKETECPIITTQCPICKTSDAGVDKVETPPPDGCDQYTPVVHIHNYGITPVHDFEVMITISPIYYGDSKMVSEIIYPGETLPVEMNTVPLPGGDYEICGRVFWPPDEDPSNDELCEEFSCEMDGGQMGSLHGRVEPKTLALFDSYPNPFTKKTTISYMVPHPTRVTIKVFDASGRSVSTLVDREETVGIHSVSWNATGLDSGVYFLRMAAGGRVFTGKATLVK